MEIDKVETYRDHIYRCIVSEDEYHIYEKKPSEKEWKIIKEILEKLAVENIDDGEILERIERYIPDDEEIDRRVIAEYIRRDLSGEGILAPLFRDDIEEISCIAPDSIYVIHRRYPARWLKTNLSFKDDEELDNYIRVLAQKIGKTISHSNPIVDAVLPNRDRIGLIYRSDIALHSSFTIRRYPETTPLPHTILSRDMIPMELLTHLWFITQHRIFGLVIGNTGAGKTTLMNTVLNLLPMDNKIVSIEETPELRLIHRHWLPLYTRKLSRGGLDSTELVISMLRHRPDYIVVGESRRDEIIALTHAYNTGHGCISTYHALGWREAIQRLTAKPYGLSGEQLEAVKYYVVLSTRRDERRVVEYVEYSGGKIYTIAKYNPHTKQYILNIEKSPILHQLKQLHGYTDEDISNIYRGRIEFLRKVVEEAPDEETYISLLKQYYISEER